MELNCAILHADQETINRLEEYIGKVPFCRYAVNTLIRWKH